MRLVITFSICCAVFRLAPKYRLMTDVRPLLTAATTGATAAVKFLLARQADVSPTDTYFRWNALHDCVHSFVEPDAA